MALHRCCKHPTAADVHIPVAQWITDGFAISFEPGEMNHPVDRRAALECAVHRLRVTDIAFDQLQ